VVTRFLLLALALAPVGCFEADVPKCTVSCATDNDCPGSLSCSAQGACAPSGQSCSSVESCTANEFVSCRDTDTLERCNATGDDTIVEECGAAGCNATGRACNACVPDALQCNGNALQRCASDGSAFTTVETCAASCVGAVAPVDAHCAYLSPRYLPDICDMPAATAARVFDTSGTLDTSLDTTCDAIITQLAGPAFCVIRAGTITVNASRSITFVGNRAVALVADSALTMQAGSLIDASANGTTNGPGGGTLTSGGAQSGASAGGGAGFKTLGAAGGGAATAGGGSAGGAVVNPLLLNSLIGGPRPAIPGAVLSAFPGGGGGALNLIACRGTVDIAGTIDVGGGGGGPGRDVVAGAQLQFITAAGGGAGGQVVFQGLQVTITGSTFANGGGGGGGSNANDLAGTAGGDGLRSTACASAGAGNGAPNGGVGGCVIGAPTIGGGGNTSSNGGGGASTGMFFVFAPAGVTPTITPASTSPVFEARQTSMTR
jgi:hypothetical protein